MKQQPPVGSSSSVLVKEFALAHLQEAFIIPSMVHFHICLESNDCMFYIVLTGLLAIVKKYLSNCTVRIFFSAWKKGWRHHPVI
jgi:hypothetical protein